MSTDRMFDLAITPLANGAFELSQQTGIDEADVIQLHPIQLCYLAERAGLLDRPAPALPRIRRDLERIRGNAADLFELLASVPSFPPQARESDDVTAARELVGMIDELLDDIDTAPDVAPVTEKRNENSTAIHVTKRGRPKKEDALTPAERQAKHRARQAELTLAEAGGER